MKSPLPLCISNLWAILETVKRSPSWFSRGVACVRLRAESDGKTPLLLLPFAGEAFKPFVRIDFQKCGTGGWEV